MDKFSVLVVDFDSQHNIAKVITRILESQYPDQILLHSMVIDKGSNEDILTMISRCSAQLVIPVFFDVTAHPAKEFITNTVHAYPDVLIAIALERGNATTLSELLSCGVTDFITPPFEEVNIVPRIQRLQKWWSNKKDILHSLKTKLGLEQLMGKARNFLEVVSKIPILAKCDAAVFLSGETGTGKELYARAIHYLGPRARNPFVPTNCGAIPSDLIENELFGHEPGAYTGAYSSHEGVVAEASGGTLFLDEVDCLPPFSQVKLLRFLQDKEFRPLGSTRRRTSDVRVIAASNANILDVIKAGRFRQDFFYRLNTISVLLPPLRERSEDIPLLAYHFLRKYATDHRKPVTDFSQDALRKLTVYTWPGNVRELEHVVERAVIFAEEKTIGSFDVVFDEGSSFRDNISFQEAKASVVAEFERTYLRKLLIASEGNISKAAQAAGKNRRAFWQLMKKHAIDIRKIKSESLLQIRTN